MRSSNLSAEGFAGVSKGTMIVVDDRDDVRKLVARIARREGYEVHDTANPSEFIELVDDQKPDVVTIDVIMPDKDGVEIISELANLGFSGKLLIMSGYHGEFLAQTGKLATAYGLDVVGILPKPLVVDDLRRILQSTASTLTM